MKKKTGKIGNRIYRRNHLHIEPDPVIPWKPQAAQGGKTQFDHKPIRKLHELQKVHKEKVSFLDFAETTPLLESSNKKTTKSKEDVAKKPPSRRRSTNPCTFLFLGMSKFFLIKGSLLYKNNYFYSYSFFLLYNLVLLIREKQKRMIIRIKIIING
jgi:hypothetical protein